MMTVLTVDSITGNAPITPNCGAERTYAFYRTMEEKERAEDRWRQAGFIPEFWEEKVSNYNGETNGYFCLRRMTKEELERDHMRERERSVSQGSSI
jgi:hypothetical protein